LGLQAGRRVGAGEVVAGRRGPHWAPVPCRALRRPPPRRRAVRTPGRESPRWLRRRRRGPRPAAGGVGPQTLEGDGRMNVNDMIFVSVDDHVVEPPDMFEGRLPSNYAEFAPRVVKTEKGDDVWTFNGVQIPNIGLNA